MPSSANKTSASHSRLIERLRTASPEYVCMSGADSGTWTAVLQSDRVWAEFDSPANLPWDDHRVMNVIGCTCQHCAKAS